MNIAKTNLIFFISNNRINYEERSIKWKLMKFTLGHKIEYFFIVNVNYKGNKKSQADY